MRCHICSAAINFKSSPRKYCDSCRKAVSNEQKRQSDKRKRVRAIETNGMGNEFKVKQSKFTMGYKSEVSSKYDIFHDRKLTSSGCRFLTGKDMRSDAFLQKL